MCHSSIIFLTDVTQHLYQSTPCYIRASMFTKNTEVQSFTPRIFSLFKMIEFLVEKLCEIEKIMIVTKNSHKVYFLKKDTQKSLPTRTSQVRPGCIRLIWFCFTHYPGHYSGIHVSAGCTSLCAGLHYLALKIPQYE